LFTVPREFVDILDRDLAAADIPKRDERGRTVDVHAMRHSSLDLTLNGYADQTVLDVADLCFGLPKRCLGVSA